MKGADSFTTRSLKPLISTVAAAIWFVAFGTMPALADEQYRPGQLIIKFKAGVTKDEGSDAMKSFGLKVTNEIENGDLGEIFYVDVPIGQEEFLAERLGRLPIVEFTQLNKIKPPL